MQRRQEILAYLKSNPAASLEGIASELGLSKQGTLRHLQALETEGLVAMEAAHEARPGRPRHVYRLTQAASDRFPQGHRQLAAELVRFLDRPQLERFFAERAERLDEEYSARLRAVTGKGARARAQAVVALATEKGHLAEVVELGDGKLAIRHRHCPIADVAAETLLPCRHEQELYARLFGGEVERTTFVGANDPDCTYVIQVGKPGKTKAAGRLAARKARPTTTTSGRTLPAAI